MQGNPEATVSAVLDFQGIFVSDGLNLPADSLGLTTRVSLDILAAQLPAIQHLL